MQKTQYIQLQTGLQNSKSNLNQLLARRADVDFDAADSLVLTYDAKYEDMINLIEKQNNALLFSQKNINIFDCSLRELKTQRSPIVDINLNYNFSRSQNQAGLILLNQNKGFNAGFTATWNLFNGFELNRQIKNSTIQVLISKYEYDMNKTQVQTNLITTFRNYVQAKTILKLEEENVKMVEQTIKIALEAFRIGKISSLELKDVQKSFDDVQVRVINARYDAKIAEAQLMHMNGVLVK
ncbi:MAG TPA: TolC family protein, partial [Bacteroidia bacterium]|nr:TolC family protein [Bacteroidia bacterium]